ncbi:serine hydrolase domain-containing protein [Cryobacterium tepidiphilum]|uniref:Class A beta-lactamase-related serine hydrolase n=1 Tax=Cryobacterium tepidiphilum TaxID=2486026 RepID=A0A3M8LP24_9MICO|nr:serine hydrolase domain-containing protein [Cryobacterium tepidiphilum]RNE67276.1 class A beta-lactamase-related serine hydrolase [Cryobacterium tepidiphilum]
MDTTGLDDFLADTEFSGVVLVRRENATVFEAATGLATQRWGIRNTLDTRFDTASITKLFTSVAVLQLVGAGRLDLERSIHDYVTLDGTTIPHDVTLLHLLTHTSGIADIAEESVGEDADTGEDYAALWARIPAYTLTETADFLPLFAHKRPATMPGVEAAYSDAGYILAGLAVENATGMPYRQYVYDEVFTRAGMTDAGFYDRRDAAPRLAEGWDQGADGLWRANLFGAPPIGSPAEGAQATAADLARFAQALRAGELLNPELTGEFFIPQVQLDDETSYGFGLEFDLNRNGTTHSWYSDGIGAGASGILRHYVDPGLDVVVLSNSEEGAWPVVRELDERLGG